MDRDRQPCLLNDFQLFSIFRLCYLAAMNAILELNSRGTLTLPKALRHALGLDRGGQVIAETSAQGILLRPSVTFPVEIYTDERVAEFDAAEAELEKRLRRKTK